MSKNNFEKIFGKYFFIKFFPIIKVNKMERHAIIIIMEDLLIHLIMYPLGISSVFWIAMKFKIYWDNLYCKFSRLKDELQKIPIFL